MKFARKTKKGIALSTEAFFSLLAVLVLLNALLLTRNALAPDYSLLYGYQLVQDVFEVSEKNGAMKKFVEGRGEAEFEKIASEIGACLIASSKNKKIEANCNKTNYSQVVSASRVVVLKDSFEKVEIGLKR